MTPTKWTSCAVEGPHTRCERHQPHEGFPPRFVWDRHSRPSPLTCHPERSMTHEVDVTRSRRACPERRRDPNPARDRRARKAFPPRLRVRTSGRCTFRGAAPPAPRKRPPPPTALVIPNRAEGPVRNLLLTSPTPATNRATSKTAKGTTHRDAAKALTEENRAPAPSPLAPQC
jgi:hypothetical protein